MRIALLTRRFDPDGGGTERDAIITARCLQAAGHSVTVYADELRGARSDFEVHAIAAPPGRALGLLSFAYRGPAMARRNGADLVLSFARTIGADILRSGGGAHVSYVRAARKWRGELAWQAMRASPYHRVQMIVERRGFTSPRLKKAIAVSNLVRDDLIRQFGLPSSKTVTLYNGVDLDRFIAVRDDSESRRLRDLLAADARAPLVTFVGNGFARKGLRFLIGAWPKIEGNAHLVVAGADRTSSSYEALARRLGVSSRVRFMGQVADVAAMLRGVDAFALPSLFEPFGNVVMEAMASGVPALSSAQSGVAELFPESLKDYVIADPRDVDELGSRMNAMLAKARSLRAEVRPIAERFTWDEYARNLLEIVTSI